MKVQALHVGMQVRHPMHGVGQVKAIAEKSAEIVFDDGLKVVEPESAELRPEQPMAALEGLHMPLAEFIRETVNGLVDELGLSRARQSEDELARKWLNGKLRLHPADSSLQPKEVPLEVFFHKIVMVRNNLRVLEQKINSHPNLTDLEKMELQQYITRSYGSLTTFNVLFRSKEDHFRSGSSVE